MIGELEAQHRLLLERSSLGQTSPRSLDISHEVRIAHRISSPYFLKARGSGRGHHLWQAQGRASSYASNSVPDVTLCQDT